MVYYYFGDKGKKKSEKLFNSLHFFSSFSYLSLIKFIFACCMEQTNQYIKQFPELMKGKKILYVHGFGSSGQSGTVTRIREVLPNATVVAPDLPVEPTDAMALLRQVCEKEQPDLIIGTSMGGMYTEMLRGYDRIMVNPALEMGDTMKEHGMMGAQHFSNPRLDGIQDFIVTKTLVKAYKEITEHCFEHLRSVPYPLPYRHPLSW